MILDVFRLDRKVALVTGASAGLGAAIAAVYPPGGGAILEMLPARCFSFRLLRAIRLMVTFW